jgi:hypothetical protein
MMDNYKHINQISFAFVFSGFGFKNGINFLQKPGGPNSLNIFELARRNFDGHILHVAERWNWYGELILLKNTGILKKLKLIRILIIFLKMDAVIKNGVMNGKKSQ